jgi:Caspase domain
MYRFAAVSVLAGLLAFLNLTPGNGPLPRAEAAENPGKVGRRALLVGCTVYPNLDNKFWLNGPGNDVQLMAKALRDIFKFPPESIVILSDEVAMEKEINYEDPLPWYPTKANIKREFENLAKAKAGDKVVIMMGGHGSQMPQDEKAPNPKSDGMSEIFLPRDVGKWDDNAGAVENAIVDHEFASWLKAIQDAKAKIWITIDACHSGTITRDVTVEKSREIDKEAGLGIPQKRVKDAEDKALKREGATRGGPIEPENTFAKLTKEKTGGLVAIYAAKPTEVTLERDMPMKAKNARPYGLLTYTLVQTLQEANAKEGSKPLTYRELVQRIQSQYFAWGRTFPTPLIEGVDTDLEVLGEKVWPGRSSIKLARGENTDLKVTGGALRGLTKDSILEVRPPKGETVLGHVRVTEVRTLDSDVEPCEYNDMKAVKAKELPLEGVCKPVFVDFGDQQLKLALDPKWLDVEKVMDKKEQERLLQTLAKLNVPKPPKNPDDPKTQPLVKLVNDLGDADWILRPNKDGKLVMMPAADLLVAKVASPRRFGPYIDSENLVEAIEESADKIARFENLKKLAGGFADDGGDQGVKFKVEMRRTTDIKDREGKFPVAWPSTDLTFYDQDIVIFRVTNTGRIPIDVTMLYLDSDFNITCLHPVRENINRIDPGKTEKLTPIRANTKTVGMEYLVVVAVKGEDQAKSFSFLQQAGLTRTRDVRRNESRAKAKASPLGQMFQAAMYGDGATRGMKTAEVDDHAMMLMSWQIRPEKRPAEKPTEKN